MGEVDEETYELWVESGDCIPPKSVAKYGIPGSQLVAERVGRASWQSELQCEMQCELQSELQTEPQTDLQSELLKTRVFF